MEKNNEKFYEIECRDICNLREYKLLKKDVRNLCSHLNKDELKLEAECKKNQAQDGINKNSSIFYPVVLSWIYAIVGFAGGSFYSDSDGLEWLLVAFFVTFILCAIVAVMLVKRSQKYMKNIDSKSYFTIIFAKLLMKYNLNIV